MSSDKSYIRRCFELALLGKGKEGTNPIVGAVIVHDGRIIGEGWHQQYGGAHAEVNAVSSVREEDIHLLVDSTIYVSLEPCFHHGNTPPCVNLILDKGFRRVVIACLDVDERVCGNSVLKLKDHGVEVSLGVLEDEGKHLVRRFFTYKQENRPYIILKWAQSKDGFIGKDGEQVWLTGKVSKTLVHKWRAEESAILVGTNTAVVDNPQLTNRLYPGEPPLRIVLDRQQRLSKTAHLMDGQVPTWYVTEQPFDHPHVRSMVMPFDEKLIPNLLDALFGHKMKSLIVEGGSELLSTFIRLGLWDEARIFTADKRLGHGIKAPDFPFDTIHERIQVGDDQLDIIMKPTS